MKFKLSAEIVSTDDLKDVISEIKVFKTWFSHNQIRAQVTKRHNSHNRPELSDAAENLIDQAKEQKELTIKKIETLISELEECASKSPKVRITLAAIPSMSIKKQVASWLRDTVSPSVLIDFRFNSALLGGMVVVVGSHIYDWSLRNKILESKDKFNEALSRV